MCLMNMLHLDMSPLASTLTYDQQKGPENRRGVAAKAAIVDLIIFVFKFLAENVPADVRLPRHGCL